MQNRFFLMGLSALVWLSPFVGLGIFFPIGVLFLYSSPFSLRVKAWTSLLVQVVVGLIYFPIEIYSLSSLDAEDNVRFFFSDYRTEILGGLFGLGFLFYLIDYVVGFKRAKTGALFNTLFSCFLSVMGVLLFVYIKGEAFDLNSFHATKELAISFWISVFIVRYWYPPRRGGFLLRPLWIQLELWKRQKSHHPSKQKVLVASNAILPGTGSIFLGDYWRGFSLLFVHLLLLLFFATALFSYLAPSFGIQFLTSLGLKPGIPDKQFFLKAQEWVWFALLGMGLVLHHFFSHSLLKSDLHKINIAHFRQKESAKEERGLRIGFWNNLPVSLLVHLILVSLVFIIPITLQRQSEAKKKGDQAKHFQPDSMEFYFIDPNIPDSTKGLNGGVITGNEAETKSEGEKITNEKVADNGPQKGFIKKIKGKKVPPTYSNYISAKMRGPEAFMDYWRRAPKPYSSVVAYTITLDGEIVDVQLVEGSNYPAQDLLTLQLIEQMAPLMPPPNAKGDIRVTELFWNGDINPDSMPTRLQKEMVLMFDGRYMEELED